MEELINNIMQSPENTNPNVLRSQLKAIQGEGSGGPGYSVKNQRTTLFDGDATTESFGSTNRTVLLEQDINAPTIFVTFDGEEYTFERTDIPNGVVYGDVADARPSFANIPFAILSRNGFTLLYTESAGTHSVKIETFEQSIELTPEFEAAVKSVIDKIISGRLLPEYANQADGATLQLREKTDGTGKKEPYWYSRQA